MKTPNITPTQKEIDTALAVLDWVASRDHAMLQQLKTENSHYSHIQIYETRLDCFASLRSFLRYIHGSIEIAKLAAKGAAFDEGKKLVRGRIVNQDNYLRPC